MLQIRLPQIYRNAVEEDTAGIIESGHLSSANFSVPSSPPLSLIHFSSATASKETSLSTSEVVTFDFVENCGATPLFIGGIASVMHPFPELRIEDSVPVFSLGYPAAVMSCLPERNTQVDEVLASQGILTLPTEANIPIDNDYDHCYFHVDDQGKSRGEFHRSNPALQRAVAWIHHKRTVEQKPVLVHCDMGYTRSASLVVAYLILQCGLAFHSAKTVICASRRGLALRKYRDALEQLDACARRNSLEDRDEANELLAQSPKGRLEVKSTTPISSALASPVMLHLPRPDFLSSSTES